MYGIGVVIWCLATLHNGEAPDTAGYRCGFHTDTNCYPGGGWLVVYQGVLSDHIVPFTAHAKMVEVMHMNLFASWWYVSTRINMEDFNSVRDVTWIWMVGAALFVVTCCIWGNDCCFFDLVQVIVLIPLGVVIADWGGCRTDAGMCGCGGCLRSDLLQQIFNKCIFVEYRN